jgi:hypothetical protein
MSLTGEQSGGSLVTDALSKFPEQLARPGSGPSGAQFLPLGSAVVANCVSKRVSAKPAA